VEALAAVNPGQPPLDIGSLGKPELATIFLNLFASANQEQAPPGPRRALLGHGAYIVSSGMEAAAVDMSKAILAGEAAQVTNPVGAIPASPDEQDPPRAGKTSEKRARTKRIKGDEVRRRSQVKPVGSVKATSSPALPGGHDSRR